MLGQNELLVILAIALLLFGGSRLPELARSLGRARVEFKRGMREEEDGKEKNPELDTAG